MKKKLFEGQLRQPRYPPGILGVGFCRVLASLNARTAA